MTPPVDISIQGTGPDPDEPTHAEPVFDPEGTQDAAEIDAQAIAPRERHPRILARFGRPAPGESFVLTNSHDPRPLRAQFEDLHADAFTWNCLESGPEVWRVRIGREAEPAAASESAAR